MQVKPSNKVPYDMEVGLYIFYVRLPIDEKDSSRIASYHYMTSWYKREIYLVLAKESGVIGP